VEEVRLIELLLLPVPAQEKKYLRLKRVMFRILIKIWEKRIFLKFFQDEARTQPIGQHPRQCGFTNTNNSFDCDVMDFGWELFCHTVACEIRC
jgi:hypothetical protein